jgi:archaellum component FlaC
MGKNTENAIVNALGDIHATLDYMKNDLSDMKSDVSDVKKSFNVFAGEVLGKLDTLDGKVTEAKGLKKEIEKHSSDIETIKKHLNIH